MAQVASSDPENTKVIPRTFRAMLNETKADGVSHCFRFEPMFNVIHALQPLLANIHVYAFHVANIRA